MNAPRITLVSALSVRRRCGDGELPEYAPPLGILTLAALVRHKYPVEVLDLDELWWRSPDEKTFSEAAYSVIWNSKPDIVGFSSVCGTFPRTIEMMRRCALELPEATLVIGGPQASVVDKAVMESFPFVDFILRGEADQTFPSLIGALAAGSSPGDVGGLTFRSGGVVVCNPNASPI